MGVVLASLPVLAELAILLGASIAAIMAALISVSPKPRPRTENERYYIDPVSGDRCPFPSLFDDLDQDASHTSNTDGLNKRKSGTSSESNPRVTLSIIIPAFDESRRLPVMLEETYAYLEQRCARDPRFSYEIIVVDDASRDNTANIARGFAKEKRMVGGLMRVMQLEKNRGKGGAVTQGMLVARGDYLLFADADGATKFSDLDNLETKLKEVAVNGMGVGIGSRAHMVKSAAVVKRSFIRNFLMHSFHTILYVLGIKKIKDTQCGFKLLTRPAARTIFPNMHVEGWIFDIELLLITDYLKIPMVEVGVNWHEVDGSKVSLLRDSVRMLKDLLVIRMNYWTGLWRVRRVAVGNSDKGKGNKVG
ncbi:dolichyl-phosphate beta-glucosyltransferase [Quaeritorhiza haematococci]|nr:dolichyl-phosphate beta-glucosyltransferase [Quaeritorhiza haematococci]